VQNAPVAAEKHRFFSNKLSEAGVFTKHRVEFWKFKASEGSPNCPEGSQKLLSDPSLSEKSVPYEVRGGRRLWAAKKQGENTYSRRL